MCSSLLHIGFPLLAAARLGDTGLGQADSTELNNWFHGTRLNFVASLQVFHPNLDLEGKICLNILREDWKPVLSISSVIYGLQFLFLVCCR